MTVPRIALRDEVWGYLDEVVVNDVSMFHAEILSDRELFMCCYFPDSDERIAFSVRVEGGKLRYYVTEQPPENEQFSYETAEDRDNPYGDRADL